MVDLLFRYPTTVSSETLNSSINHRHHHYVVAGTRSPMYASASPVAVENKIRAIQKRKSRIILQSYYDFTDIRPLNIGNSGGTTNISESFSNISPQKLLEHSKNLRLGRLSTNHNSRPSVLSRTSTTNHQSSNTSGYNSPIGFAKQSQANSSTVSSNVHKSQIDKPSARKMPNVTQDSNRAHPPVAYKTLTEKQTSLITAQPRHKFFPKAIPSTPKAYYRTIPHSGKPPFPTTPMQSLQVSTDNYLKESKNIQSSKLIDIHKKQDNDVAKNTSIIHEEYLRQSIVKCADWLIKYVFDKEYDGIDE